MFDPWTWLRFDSTRLGLRTFGPRQFRILPQARARPLICQSSPIIMPDSPADTEFDISSIVSRKSFAWGARTFVMAILNVTPDSFSGDGTMRGDNWITNSIEQAVIMESEGADAIDIGGESTRPASVYRDAQPVPAEEEMARVLPVVEGLAARVKVPISIDTRKSRVAEEALKLGASVINDISMLSDPDMASVAADSDADIVICHNKQVAEYDDVPADIGADLASAVERAIDSGVAESRIIVDPGIGFAKNAQHSLEAMRRLREIRAAVGDYPMLVGPSRKSFIAAVLDESPHRTIDGNAAATTLAVMGGADMIRVHEVRSMANVVKVADAFVRGWSPDMNGISDRALRAIRREV